jgi:hypothetical protein
VWSVCDPAVIRSGNRRRHANSAPPGCSALLTAPCQGRDQTFNAVKAVAEKPDYRTEFMSEVSCIMGVTIRRA